MGSQASKGEVVVEAKAAAADAVTVKTNGQVWNALSSHQTAHPLLN